MDVATTIVCLPKEINNEILSYAFNVQLECEKYIKEHSLEKLLWLFSFGKKSC